METVFVRAGGHVVRAAQTFVGENLRNAGIGSACCDVGLRAEPVLGAPTCLHRAQTSRMRAQRLKISSGVAGRKTVPMFAGKFGLIQLVVAANQNNDRLAVGDVNQRFDLAIGRNFVRLLAQAPRW